MQPWWSFYCIAHKAVEREEIKRMLEQHHQEDLDRWPPELRPEREVLWQARRTIVHALTQKNRAKLNPKWLEARPEAEKDKVVWKASERSLMKRSRELTSSRPNTSGWTETTKKNLRRMIPPLNPGA